MDCTTHHPGLTSVGELDIGASCWQFKKLKRKWGLRQAGRLPHIRYVFSCSYFWYVAHAASKGIFENILGFNPELSTKLVAKTTILDWLLTRIQSKAHDENRGYAAELLSILLQNIRENRLEFGKKDGVEVCLKVLSVSMVITCLHLCRLDSFNRKLAIQTERPRRCWGNRIHGKRVWYTLLGIKWIVRPEDVPWRWRARSYGVDDEVSSLFFLTVNFILNYLYAQRETASTLAVYQNARLCHVGHNRYTDVWSVHQGLRSQDVILSVHGQGIQETQIKHSFPSLRRHVTHVGYHLIPILEHPLRIPRTNSPTG